MKISRFNYFLEEGEKAIYNCNCRLKAITTFQIVDTNCLLIASNTRLIFCQVIGQHPHIFESFKYKYISSLELKNDDGIYLYGKYNGDPFKIKSLDEIDMQKIMQLVSNSLEITMGK